MIVCKSCGASSEDGDDFCGSCGAFLEWEGERVEAPATVVATKPEVEDAAGGRPGLIERVRSAVGMDEANVATHQAEEDVRRAEEAAAEARRAEEAAAQAEADAAAAQAEARRMAENAAAAATRQAEEAARRQEQESARLAQEAARVAEDEARVAADEAARRGEDEAEAAAAAGEAKAGEEARAAADLAEAERRAIEERNRTETEERQLVEKERRAAEARAEEERLAANEERRVALARAEADRRAAAERSAAEAVAKAEAAAKARAEAEARAESARRAAAMVAKPKPAVDPAAASEMAGAAAAQSATSARAPGGEAAGTGARQPEAQKPGRVLRPPPHGRTPSRPSRPVRPGDLICGQCGEVNDPERKFCRRCGSSLVEAVHVKVPWWRRVIGLFRQRKKVVAAGERPMRARGVGGRRRSVGSRVRVLVSRTLAVAVPLMVVLSFFGPFKQTIRDKAGEVARPVTRIIQPRYEPVRPSGVSATSEAPDHPALLTIDGIRNNFWAEGAAGSGEGQALVLTFDEPTDIDRIGFTIGASAKPEDFQTQPRPRELHLVYSNGTSDDIELRDTAEFQRASVKARDVTRVELQIVSVYTSLQGDACAIAEIELFAKR